MYKQKSPVILFEDNHLIAAFKKSGQTVQPEPDKPISLEEEVKAYLKAKYKKPGDVFLGVIHRLDMPVSGIVLFARTSKALVRMNQIFQKREVKKIYRAIVENNPPKANDLLVHWLKRDEVRNFSKAYLEEVENAEKAQLIYDVTEVNAVETTLKIELMTGRKHQIRVQLAAIGCPITGDTKYGASKALKHGAIGLQAVELTFVHPVQKTTVSIKLP